MEHKNTHIGRVFLVTAPSGAGKSSLVNALLKLEPAIKLSISHTTRQPRPGEENGREYHFVSEAEFLTMKERDEFLETALVHGARIGLKSRLSKATTCSLKSIGRGLVKCVNASRAPWGSLFSRPRLKRLNGVCTTAVLTRKTRLHVAY